MMAISGRSSQSTRSTPLFDGRHRRIDFFDRRRRFLLSPSYDTSLSFAKRKQNGKSIDSGSRPIRGRRAAGQVSIVVPVRFGWLQPMNEPKRSDTVVALEIEIGGRGTRRKTTTMKRVRHLDVDNHRSMKDQVNATSPTWRHWRGTRPLVEKSSH